VAREGRLAGGRRGAAKPLDWNRVVARLSVRLGWTWDVVLDTVTMAMWEAYEDYWSDHPTVDDCAAAYLGVKPKDAEPDAHAMTPAEFARWVKSTGGAKLGPGG